MQKQNNPGCTSAVALTLSGTCDGGPMRAGNAKAGHQTHHPTTFLSTHRSACILILHLKCSRIQDRGAPDPSQGSPLDNGPVPAHYTRQTLLFPLPHDKRDNYDVDYNSMTLQQHCHPRHHRYHREKPQMPSSLALGRPALLPSATSSRPSLTATSCG